MMRPERIVDHMAALSGAKTMEELRERYVLAYKVAQTAGDIAALERFTTIKDKRKKALEDQFTDSQESAMAKAGL